MKVYCVVGAFKEIFSLFSGSFNKVLFLVFVCFSFNGCVLGPDINPSFIATDNSKQSYKLYPGNLRSKQELVSIDLEEVDYAIIDGFRVDKDDYQIVLLLPGEYTIRWGKTFAFSVMVDPRIWQSSEKGARVQLIEGRNYTLHAARTYGQNYRLFFWIHDRVTDEVIAGERKP